LKILKKAVYQIFQHLFRLCSASGFVPEPTIFLSW